MYTITVRPRSLNGKTVTIVSVEKQTEKSPVSQFSCSLEIDGSNLKAFGTPKMAHETNLWNARNFIVIAKCLFAFFARTKHAASRKWTEGWYVSGSTGADTYKMYDCSLMFIAVNVSLAMKFVTCNEMTES